MSKKQLESNYLSYYLAYLAHEKNGDAEGMNICKKGLMEELIANVTVLKKARDMADMGVFEDLACHECSKDGHDEYTWTGFEMTKKGIVMYGDCGHSRILKVV